MRYFALRWPHPSIPLEIEQDPPPCMWCGVPVISTSCDGPLVCVPCDMGQRADGTPKTDEDYARELLHMRAYIERYRIDG